MQTYDLLTSMNGGLRELATQRWGLPAMPPRVLAATMVRPRAATRVVRRAADAGAGQLARLLVEYGGRAVPPSTELEAEAERLQGWFPMEATEEGWCMPSDLAVAAFGAATCQRLFATTMLAALDDDARAAVFDELDIPSWGLPALRVVRAVEAILAAPWDDESAAAAQRTAELGAIDLIEVASLTPVAGTGGRRWRLETTDGTVTELAPRELAERCDLRFAAPEVVVREPETPARAPRLRLPTHVPVGAIVSFSSARAADDALRLGDFRTVVLHRLDERRVATREDCDARSALLILARLGFAVDRDVDEVSR